MTCKRLTCVLLCCAISTTTLAADPLSCFILHPESAKPDFNACFGKYEVHSSASHAADCADLCLDDARCDAFVFGTSKGSTDCRLSYDCPAPTSFLAGWDGYIRNSTIGSCATKPISYGFGNSTNPGLWADGMILQRDAPTSVWGTGPANTTVVVSVTAQNHTVLSRIEAYTDSSGHWFAQLATPVPASRGTTLTVAGATWSASSAGSASIKDVSWGDVILCGGQSNMGFGMCGARDMSQTSQQALDALPTGDRAVRFFFQQGSGPNGGAGVSYCRTSAGAPSLTPAQSWVVANASNAGGMSAVCLLTAAYLSQHLASESGEGVSVGAVESCVGGTNVEPWTPPMGSLWLQNMVPLLPYSFRLALWDQGEADAKRTNSTWYATEFPTMIERWRAAFGNGPPGPALPFFYVELDSEYGAQRPKEADFWAAQRAALALPATGFASTVDVERGLHPPDKMDIARRLLLEIRRVSYAEHTVVSRGPELLSHSVKPAPRTTSARAPTSTPTMQMQLTMSNASLAVHGGIFVGTNASCSGSNASDGSSHDGALMQLPSTPLNYSISGNTITVNCTPGTDVMLNAETSECYVYGSKPPYLPAPPVSVPCSL